MPPSSAAGRLQSITDSGAAPPTSKDDALAADVMELRRLLLRTHRAVQERLRSLAVHRPRGAQHAWPAREGLRYYIEAEQLVRDLDGAWSLAEIDALVTDSGVLEDRIDGRRGLGLGLVAGRPGRPRRTTPSILDLVARSIALRAGGLPTAQADETAADEHNKGLPPRYWITGSSIGVYRKRLRDRLA